MEHDKGIFSVQRSHTSCLGIEIEMIRDKPFLWILWKQWALLSCVTPMLSSVQDRGSAPKILLTKWIHLLTKMNITQLSRRWKFSILIHFIPNVFIKESWYLENFISLYRWLKTNKTPETLRWSHPNWKGNTWIT